MTQTPTTEVRYLIWLPISLPFMDPKCSSPFSEQHANIHFLFSNLTSLTPNSLRVLPSVYASVF